jgi:hypothetical protein
MNGWTREFPTEAGWYWFYGNQFRSSQPSLHIVKVFKSINSFVCVCDGAFMYESELGEKRWFKQIDTSEVLSDIERL